MNRWPAHQAVVHWRIQAVVHWRRWRVAACHRGLSFALRSMLLGLGPAIDRAHDLARPQHDTFSIVAPCGLQFLVRYREALLDLPRTAAWEKGSRQWRSVPSYASPRIGDHVGRSVQRRQCIIEELAIAWQHFCPGVQERPWRDYDPRCGTSRPNEAVQWRKLIGFRSDAARSVWSWRRTWRLIRNWWRGHAVGRITLLKRIGSLVEALCAGPCVAL